jgi:hypothetical protein
MPTVNRWLDGEKMLPFELSGAEVADADADEVVLDDDCGEDGADDVAATVDDEALALEEAGGAEVASTLLLVAGLGMAMLEEAIGRFLSGAAAAVVVTAAGTGTLTL